MKETCRVLALALIIATSATLAFAQSNAPQFVPFGNFMESTRTAGADKALLAPGSQVRDASAFEEMRQAILDRYEGVEVAHSFVIDGMHYDCVPMYQQPAVRTYGLTSIATPPPELPHNRLVDPAGNVRPATQLDAEKPFDDYGNAVACEADTVPLPRTTLETMTRFATLRKYYQKEEPVGTLGEMSDRGRIVPGGPPHKYSVVNQTVNNMGGNSNLNLWSPYVNTSKGEIFSLSQEWYVGGSGTTLPGLQTEEIGWVVYPAMFSNSEKAHFFIFSTADGYNTTGCWNNSCGDFVQVNSFGVYLGAPFSNYSTTGGAQYEAGMAYELYGGNWWVGLQGTWIGYYPNAKYKGGQNTHYAQHAQYGTESDTSAETTTTWPPEGSGAWPNTGWEHAAYQRDLWYFDTINFTHWATLSLWNASTNCYKIAGPYNSTGLWTRYFYDGGPGGAGCK